MAKHYTIARSSLFCTRRAAIKSKPPSSKDTPENIDRERSCFFSPIYCKMNQHAVE
ncbi:unnamed protein product [Penicillium roqueforti FM164]|uniref:Uncharacterized protein n=1 Tax=Penicillium roqueforti (strain FM164) TaxID=1365484 RepID=W6QIB2_PENRF|nr:unnamed protein product [Penicillium roqueforti FM164]